MLSIIYSIKLYKADSIGIKKFNILIFNYKKWHNLDLHMQNEEAGEGGT